MQRKGNRSKKSLRKVRITRNYIKYAEGSCLIEAGDTRIVCTASVENGVPPFLRGKGTGWLSSEYGMIPRSCRTRVAREATKGRPAGRTQEIQRIIGRSLRAIVDLDKIGERTIWLDCDVIQADSGTRCLSITGSFVALCDALEKIRKEGVIEDYKIKDHVAAVSVGIIDGEEYLDLDYEEDAKADVDMNIVMTGSGEFIEIQGTAEKSPFSRNKLERLLDLAKKGIQELINIQKDCLKSKK